MTGNRRTPVRLLLAAGLAAAGAALLLWALPGGWRPGRPAMTERLARILEDRGSLHRWYTLPEQVERRRRELERAGTPRERLDALFELGQALLLLGDSEEAIVALAEARDLVGQFDPAHATEESAEIWRWLSVAHLRLGEQDNCIARHTAESCLMPIRGEGVYEVTRGPRGAVEVLERILERRPGDVGARWLLNLAWMTLGGYPEGVPERWRIPPSVFASEHDVGRFRDVAPALGLDVLSLAGGSVMEDFDGDGFLDLMVSGMGVHEQIRCFRSNGDGTFSDVTERAGLTGLLGGLNLVHADYDNDGDADVFVLRGAWMGRRGRHPNSLLRNNGDGTFTDVTEEAGLLSFHPTQTAAWGDYDNDGWLDLFVGNESRPAYEEPCELFRNNGDGTFTEIAAEVGLRHVGFVKAAVWGDIDNDGRLDLYLSRQSQPNVLYRNEGPPPGRGGAGGWRFTDVTARAGVAEPEKSFPAWFWDFDNDGWQDLFVCGFSDWEVDSLDAVAAAELGLEPAGTPPALYRNNGDGTFTDMAGALGLRKELLGMGANYGDIDNDGWLDFYVGTGKPHLWSLVPNKLFRSDGARRFQDVTTSAGVGHIQKGHGIAFGDLDNDGDQDIYAEMGGAWPTDAYQNALFLNPGHGHRWVTLQLEGTRSNRCAIGARIRTVVRTEGGERTIHSTVSTGGSFGSSSLQQELGLGKAAEILRVEITWPATGQVQLVEGVPMERTVRIVEGTPGFRTVERRAIRLDGAGKAGGGHVHGGG